jgi:hypothetical protein
MEKEEILKSFKTVDAFGEYVQRSRKAYGMCEGAFGLIVFVGFMLMHLLLYRVAWYWIAYLGIIGTFLIAFFVNGFLARGVTSRIGEAKSWMNVYSNRIWSLAILGGVCLTTVTASIPFVMEGALSNPVPLMCYILLGWFVADGIGMGATGIITGSRGNLITGILLIVSAIPIASFALEYAFLLFGLMCGIGCMVSGFSDYRSWLSEAKGG